jgi:GT2 family glycosyltransferase
MQIDFDYAKEQIVDQVMGAFMLAPRKILEQHGSFDESFFNWFEEVDLQYRLHQAGYNILYTPEVECIHVKGPSFSQLRRPQAQRIFNASMRYYFRKNHSAIAALWLQSIQPISIVLSYATQLVR